MKPASTQINIYQNSTNGFLFIFNREDGTPFDLNEFEKAEVALFMKRDGKDVKHTFTPSINNNVASVTITPTQTENIFVGKNYYMEFRLYHGDEDFFVYVTIEVNLLNVFNTDGRVYNSNIVVNEDDTVEITITESALYASIAHSSAERAQDILDQIEYLFDNADFDPSGDYEFLRARATTAEDVGLEHSMGSIYHGDDGDVPRPSGYSIITWVGSIEPQNAEDNDIWFLLEN